MNMSQYGKYKQEESHDQRICVRPSKLLKKAFKYYIRKKIAMAWTNLERRES